MTRTCATCPAFLAEDANEQQAKLGAMTAVPICARFGTVLATPAMNDDERTRALEEKGSSCSEHGNPFEWVPVALRQMKPQMFMPDPDLMVPTNVPVTQCRSCTMCANFVNAGDAYIQHRVGTGVCSAQGTLVFQHAEQDTARMCQFRSPGTSTRTTMKLLPQLDPAFKAPVQKVSKTAIVDNDKHSGDPREYVSDRPVSAGEHRAFIRAWRSIDDPEGLKPPVWLPIFDGPRISEHYGIEACAKYDESGQIVGYDNRLTYRNYRPDLYVDHQGLLYDLACEFMETKKVPCLNGPAGTGKSESGCWMAYLMDLPFHVIDIEKGTEPHMLEGEKDLVPDPTRPDGQVTVFTRGTFTQWYELPCVIMVNEPNLKTEVFMWMRGALGSAKELQIKCMGTRMTQGKYTFVMLSQNPAWLPEYIGTEMLNAADLERVTPIYMPIPSPEIERQIILAHCLDEGYNIDDLTLDYIMQIAKDIREQIALGYLPIAWGIRSQIKVALATKVYSIQKAYRRAITDGIEPALVNIINPIVTSVVG